MVDIAGNLGCSSAVAREAASSSATDIMNDDIVQRMPSGALNLQKVASAMGRGPNHDDDGELDHRLECDSETHKDILRVTDARIIGKTSDVMGSD